MPRDERGIFTGIMVRADMILIATQEEQKQGKGKGKNAASAAGAHSSRSTDQMRACHSSLTVSFDATRKSAAKLWTISAKASPLLVGSDLCKEERGLATGSISLFVS